MLMKLIKLTERQVDKLLMAFDDLYRMTSTPLWHEERRDKADGKKPAFGKSNFKIHEECYDIFKKERKLALAESGIRYYKGIIKKVNKNEE